MGRKPKHYMEKGYFLDNGQINSQHQPKKLIICLKTNKTQTNKQCKNKTCVFSQGSNCHTEPNDQVIGQEILCFDWEVFSFHIHTLCDNIYAAAKLNWQY